MLLQGHLLQYLFFSFHVLFFRATYAASSLTAGNDEVISWLQSQSTDVAAAQHAIKSFLNSKRIPLGSSPRSLAAGNIKDNILRIGLSTDENNFE